MSKPHLYEMFMYLNCPYQKCDFCLVSVEAKIFILHFINYFCDPTDDERSGEGTDGLLIILLLSSNKMHIFTSLIFLILYTIFS